MDLKTATAIALAGVGASYGMSLIGEFSHGLRGFSVMHFLRGALFNVSLLIFLFTLHKKQQ